MNRDLMAGGPRVALLVDVDNVNKPSVLDAVIGHIAASGVRLTIRRAYGGHAKLVELRECLLRHGFRSMANSGTGTTDALLVVDAMDLLHGGHLGDAVAIASSDADFAPLAVRLREAGLRVVCYAQSAKSADGRLSRAYDDTFYLDDEPPARLAEPVPAAVAAAAAAPAKASKPPRPPKAAKASKATKKAAKAPAAAPAQAPAPAARKPAPAPAVKRRGKGSKAAFGVPPQADMPSGSDDPEEVQHWLFEVGDEDGGREIPFDHPAAAPVDPVRAILEAMPGFLAGEEIELGEVVQRLRAAKLLSRSASGPNYLRRAAPYVELSPARNPHKLRFAGLPLGFDDETPF